VTGTRSTKAVVFSDGASAGNPGAAGVGAVVRFGGAEYEISEPIGVATNNVAEYRALIRGLEEARLLGAREVAAYLDSELLVRQLTGAYRVRNPGLLPLYEKAVGLLRSFASASVTHVPRDRNKRADALAKKASAAQKSPVTHQEF
jgi:ribonuclease HI